MGVDEQLIKICLNKMKNSASRIETLNSYDIDPNYHKDIKKLISKEIQKEIHNYVKIFTFLEEYLLTDKIDNKIVPSIESIEESIWEQKNDKQIDVSDIINNVKDNNDEEYDELISEIFESNDQNIKINPLKNDLLAYAEPNNTIEKFMSLYTKIDKQNKQNQTSLHIDNIQQEEINDFLNIYKIYKETKESNNEIQKSILLKPQIPTIEPKVNPISKIVCPRCENITPFAEKCSSCGYPIQEYNHTPNKEINRELNSYKTYKNSISEASSNSNDIINQEPEDTLYLSSEASVLIDPINDVVIEEKNQYQPEYIEPQISENSEQDQNTLLETRITKNINNLMMTVGSMTSVGGLYLIGSDIFMPKKSSGLELAINTIISLTDFLPGIFVPLYDLVSFQPYIIGIILLIIGINLVFIIVGLQKNKKLFKNLSIVVFLLAIYWDVIRFISKGFLKAPWSLIGIIPNLVILYCLYNEDNLKIPFLK